MNLTFRGLLCVGLLAALLSPAYGQKSKTRDILAPPAGAKQAPVQQTQPQPTPPQKTQPPQQRQAPQAQPPVNQQVQQPAQELRNGYGLQTRGPAPRPADDWKAVTTATAPLKGTVSGPYTYKNLSVYLIHGPETYPGASFLTLDEALKAKKAIVHETGDVGELQIENVSADVHVYIQSGDIVKGGQQDRTLAFDLIVPPKSGKLPLRSFCVEHGRWHARGGESVAQFSGSANQLASKDLKIAARYNASQQEVWSKVAEAQDKLSKNVGGNVQSAASASSLQLTLENAKVREAVGGYSKELTALPDKHKDAIGFAFAINGQFNSAEAFGSRALFLKFWPKLLEAASIESVSETKPDAKFEIPTVAVVEARLREVEKAPRKELDATERVNLATVESKSDLLFETRDRAGGQMLRRSYLSK